MSDEKIDVLAVMQADLSEASIRRSDRMCLESATAKLSESWAAHDAVAELIAAVEESPKSDRLRAALARVRSS